MSVSNRFHLFVASTTITVAFWIVSLIHPWQAGVGKFALAYIGSAAFYQLLATALRWLFDQIRVIRKFVLGREFLEGTWIGSFDQSPKKRFTVEHFEQTVDGVVIRGYAFTESDALYADWISRSVTFDSTLGTLTYSYDCNVLDSKTSFQGIAFFNVQRATPRKPPHAMTGYSADLIDGARSTNLETKLSDRQVDLIEARQAAKQLC
jgi:hypothetical protein